eukprot:gnl/TRDRNA2_/TRDRNA2_160329_c0_seq1.p1 gnl/TRDRNA2_/TRDRNA2_160329_c0~~gnl/TRDRNA2_/TRDRNA2_160329_c0_seq1.p1  ORF type:complete len:281 (-),score=49.69 gnl/TRDRNA2_/TRDRNA2_160329_c0_seq1:40-882(-)
MPGVWALVLFASGVQAHVTLRNSVTSFVGSAAGKVLPSQTRGPSTRRCCGILCAGRCDEVQREALATQPLDRRSASLAIAIGALVGPAMRPASVLAEDEAGFNEGPLGLKYRDLVSGTGDVPSDGDQLSVCDNFGTCGDLTKQVDDSKLFTFTLGGNEVLQGWNVAILGGQQMPPMKVGGTRNVIIPPSLGYGSQGLGCNAAGGNCQIPPNSELEFTIQLVAIKSKKRALLSANLLSAGLHASASAAALIGLSVGSAAASAVFRICRSALANHEVPLLAA